MALKLVTPPASYPLTLAELKKHLRVDFSDDDEIIERYLKAAIAYGENYTGRAFVPQTWDYFQDEFPVGADVISLPNPPLVEVSGVFYGGAGAEQEFPAESYVVDTVLEKARIGLPSGGSWPTITAGLNQVRVRFVAGYVDEDSPQGSDVPDDIINAIVLLVMADYDNDIASDRNRQSATALLRARRVHTGMA